jgi:hypothetical protein
MSPPIDLSLRTRLLAAKLRHGDQVTVKQHERLFVGPRAHVAPDPRDLDRGYFGTDNKHYAPMRRACGVLAPDDFAIPLFAERATSVLRPRYGEAVAKVLVDRLTAPQLMCMRPSELPGCLKGMQFGRPEPVPAGERRFEPVPAAAIEDALGVLTHARSQSQKLWKQLFDTGALVHREGHPGEALLAPHLRGPVGARHGVLPAGNERERALVDRVVNDFADRELRDRLDKEAQADMGLEMAHVHVSRGGHFQVNEHHHRIRAAQKLGVQLEVVPCTEARSAW